MAIINFKTEVKSQANSNTGEFEPIPMDRFILTAEKAEASKTQKGGDKIQVTFVIESGEQSQKKYAKRKIWHSFNIGGKSNIYLFNYLQAISSPLVDQDDVTLEDICKAIQGSKVSALAEPGMSSTNKPVSNLSNFKAIGGVVSAATPTAAKSDSLFS